MPRTPTYKTPRYERGNPNAKDKTDDYENYNYQLSAEFQAIKDALRLVLLPRKFQSWREINLKLPAPLRRHAYALDAMEALITECKAEAEEKAALISRFRLAKPEAQPKAIEKIHYMRHLIQTDRAKLPPTPDYLFEDYNK